MYVRQAFQQTSDPKSGSNIKSTAAKNTDVSAVSGEAVVKLQSKLLNISLLFAQIMKTGETVILLRPAKKKVTVKKIILR